MQKTTLLFEKTEECSDPGYLESLAIYRKIAEKMITLAKRGDLHARRQALAYIYDETVVTKLFEEIAPKYADRNGGYTRIVKIGQRKGDAAMEVLLELV